MINAFVCDAIRTPFGRYGGSLSAVRADDLAAVPLQALMARNTQVDWGQVAEMLSISEHTLRVYIESARFKLGATNTTHAVAKAITEGLIVIGGAARGTSGDWPGKAPNGA